jgi:hypothetical protein
MRAAHSEIKALRKANQMGHDLNIRIGLTIQSGVRVPGGDSVGVRPSFASDFFLFYLTGNTFFDNGLGLLKKFDCGRAETLSAVQAQ